MTEGRSPMARCARGFTDCSCAVTDSISREANCDRADAYSIRVVTNGNCRLADSVVCVTERDGALTGSCIICTDSYCPSAGRNVGVADCDGTITIRCILEPQRDRTGSAQNLRLRAPCDRTGA